MAHLWGTKPVTIPPLRWRIVVLIKVLEPTSFSERCFLACLTLPRIPGAQVARLAVQELARKVVLAVPAGDQEGSDLAVVLAAVVAVVVVLVLALDRVDLFGPGPESDPLGCLPQKCCSNISTERKRES